MLDPIYKDRIKSCCIGAGLILMLGFGGYNVYHHHALASQYTSIQRKSEKLNVSTNRLVKENAKPKYVVNAKGKLDYGARDTIRSIQDELDNDLTFNSPSQYRQNLKSAHRYIHDSTFFDEFMKPYVDSSGDSELGVLDIKGRNGNTQVYEIHPGKYLVVTNYYLYHNPKDFDVDSDNLPTVSAEFIMTGNAQDISKVQVLGPQLVQ